MRSTLKSPGRLVSLRGREWVVLPSDDTEVLLLKPLGGSDEEITGIYQPLGFAEDEPSEAIFPNPKKEDLGAFSSARLLLESSRLAFRNGAGPFRCLAKLSFRPRAYQMIPLIMEGKDVIGQAKTSRFLSAAWMNCIAASRLKRC